MSRVNLKGMGVALITPFKSDKTIDFQALAHLVEYQIRCGIDFIVVLGTTAETPT
ncbi:MAG: dihydrodipicolinate synthase family protein, partial [Muribaculaceae bacterium]|nr:dihydrodipicolinate synthase family protein [Muribaculaceae bacterium]